MNNKIINTNTLDMKNKVGIYRTKNELTLKQLSDRTGISTTTLSKIENEHTNDILLSNAIILAKVLKVDLYELFCIK